MGEDDLFYEHEAGFEYQPASVEKDQHGRVKISYPEVDSQPLTREDAIALEEEQIRLEDERNRVRESKWRPLRGWDTWKESFSKEHLDEVLFQGDAIKVTARLLYQWLCRFRDIPHYEMPSAVRLCDAQIALELAEGKLKEKGIYPRALKFLQAWNERRRIEKIRGE